MGGSEGAAAVGANQSWVDRGNPAGMVVWFPFVAVWIMGSVIRMLGRVDLLPSPQRMGMGFDSGWNGGWRFPLFLGTYAQCLVSGFPASIRGVVRHCGGTDRFRSGTHGGGDELSLRGSSPPWRGRPMGSTAGTGFDANQESARKNDGW